MLLSVASSCVVVSFFVEVGTPISVYRLTYLRSAFVVFGSPFDRERTVRDTNCSIPLLGVLENVDLRRLIWLKGRVRTRKNR